MFGQIIDIRVKKLTYLIGIVTVIVTVGGLFAAEADKPTAEIKTHKYRISYTLSDL